MSEAQTHRDAPAKREPPTAAPSPTAAQDIERLRCDEATLAIDWADGRSSEFSSLWLRDNVREDRDPHSGQRLIDIADLPENPRLRSAVVKHGSVLIEWHDDPCTARFASEWLLAHAAGSSGYYPSFSPTLWLDGSGLDARRDFAWLALAEARNDATQRSRWLTRLLQDGMAFVSAVPAIDTALLDAVSLLGQVAETNYGRVFDVRSVAQPDNLAYSDLGLGLHTDNPYREPVPGFQALHALIASPDGGDSLFADGFALAEHLRSTDPEAFARLTQTPVPFDYRAPDAELHAERPLIQLNCVGEVQAVHYNNRSIAPLRLPAAQITGFYRAYRRFAQTLRDPRFQLQFVLGDGDLVVFDNHRILHGRTAFSSARHPRHLRGCYLTRDSVYNEAALLRRGLAPEARS